MLRGQCNGRPASFLVDSGATHDFVAQRFVDSENSAESVRCRSHTVWMADGRACPTTQELSGRLQLGAFSEERLLLVCPFEGYDVVLGKPWLTDHNPLVDWKCHTAQMCVPAAKVEDAACEQGGPPMSVPILLKGKMQPIRVLLLSTQKPVRVSAMLSNEVVAGALDRKLMPKKYLGKGVPEENKNPLVGQPPVLDLNRLSDVLDQYADVFAPLPAGLPPARQVDHVIDLEPGAKPCYRPTYRMSPLELQEVRKQLDELLSKGWIRPSAEQALRPCCCHCCCQPTIHDYQYLSHLTNYPLANNQNPFLDYLYDHIYTTQWGAHYCHWDCTARRRRNWSWSYYDKGRAKLIQN